MFDLQTTRSLNRLFDEAFGPVVGTWMPPVDIFESAGELRIVAEMPGVKPEDIRISSENNVLTLRGDKHQAQPAGEKGERAHRYERAFGAFERSFTIPTTVDAERIEARYEHGVLTLVLPKAEKAKPRQIQVQVTA